MQALVTGVSRGIGEALARRLLEAGYFVIGTSTSGKARIEHENFKILPLDLSKHESIEACAREITQMAIPLDVLINNAGMSVLEEEDEPRIIIEYLRKTLEVNLIGTIDFTERIVPLIKDGGCIINISSRAGSLEHEGYTVNAPTYRISKAALNMFTRILAKRLAGRIKVSSVHPGWTKTDMGGPDAHFTPEEVAADIVDHIHTDVETGGFWYRGERFPW